MSPLKRDKFEHVHKLKRHTYSNNNRIYFCTLPECHFKVEVPLSLGKKSLCNRCGKEFIMNERSMRLKFPHCDDCSKRRIVNETTGQIKYVQPEVADVINKVADDHIEELKNRLSAIVKTSDVSVHDDADDEI